LTTLSRDEQPARVLLEKDPVLNSVFLTIPPPNIELGSALDAIVAGCMTQPDSETEPDPCGSSSAWTES
jgi:hypothetical protein